MKLEEIAPLDEMTMRAPSYEALGTRIEDYRHVAENGEHVGDIESYEVKRVRRPPTFDDYVVIKDGNIVAFFTFDGDELTIAYVVPNERKNKLLAAFLLFAKRHEGRNLITMGSPQSEAMIGALKHLSDLFRMSWKNLRDGEKVDYDPREADKFYGIGRHTDWRIVLESDETSVAWPRFRVAGMPSSETLLSFYFGFLKEDV